MSEPLKKLPALPTARPAGDPRAMEPMILHHLFRGLRRLSEIERLIPAIMQKVPIPQLRELEARGPVHREVRRRVPRRMHCSATPPGASIEPVLRTPCAWGRRSSVWSQRP